jgi:DNA (cytosine-5)-methyltransferase 1
VVAENVCGLLTLQSGVVFERVCADMENAGYEVQPFVVPACAVGAPHRRDRIWIVAHSAIQRQKSFKNRAEIVHTSVETRLHGRSSDERDVSDTKSKRFQERDAEPLQWNAHRTVERYSSVPCWQNFPTQSPVCCRNDGISHELDDITFSKWRIESIKALGNAIVPQIAYQIFKAIEKVEQINNQ